MVLDCTSRKLKRGGEFIPIRCIALTLIALVLVSFFGSSEWKHTQESPVRVNSEVSPLNAQIGPLSQGGSLGGSRPQRGNQSFGGRGFRGRRGNPLDFDRTEFPTWDVDRGFGRDLFTFVRIKTDPRPVRGFRRDWAADYPDADFYFSFRLQQLTSLNVDPNPKVLELTDPKLSDYPFALLAAPQSIDFSEAEVRGLRDYLNNGGFVMVDEFFGEIHWNLFYEQLKRVFPDAEPKELDLSHEIFHNVYNFDFVPQVTAIHFWQRWGITYHPVAGTERDHEPHFFGVHDKNGRMMMLLCYNNDLMDGWEREGEDREFFLKFSVRQSYPMGINIITYAMTH